MQTLSFLRVSRVGFAIFLTLAMPHSVLAKDSGELRQAIASAVSNDADLNQFYGERAYKPLWTGGAAQDRRRQRAFLDALDDAGDHGLPAASYDAGALKSAVNAARTPGDLARLEVALSRAFAEYARDVQSGVVNPRAVSREIHRDAPRRGTAGTLAAFSKSSPTGFMASLPPQTDEYARLLDEKARLERALGAGGWGRAVPDGTLKPGMADTRVAILRARLAALGYGRASGSTSFDADLQQHLARFQRDHGLLPDGIVGPGTRAELNKDPDDRLKQVLAAMERERWMNLPRGKRHIWVNIADYTAKIMDGDRVTFETRSVVGQNLRTHRTPEFSDVMEFMVINPTWNVPHSITTREYLPMLQQNPNAVSHLTLLDRSGNRVSRGSVNFANYSAGNFPYRLKEPPNQGNALGLVKFMFPNQHNIYLHDTPKKALFQRQPRAYSNGCIRLADPFDFAYALLARQTANPKGFFQAKLATGRETTVMLETPVRVHLVYRTAFTQPNGPVQYRPDVYGRDAQVFAALAKAGVSLRAAGG